MIAQKLNKAALDLLLVAGGFVFTYGVWLAWRPGGFMVGGLFVVALALFLGYDLDAIRRRG